MAGIPPWAEDDEVDLGSVSTHRQRRGGPAADSHTTTTGAHSEASTAHQQQQPPPTTTETTATTTMAAAPTEAKIKAGSDAEAAVRGELEAQQQEAEGEGDAVELGGGGGEGEGESDGVVRVRLSEALGMAGYGRYQRRLLFIVGFSLCVARGRGRGRDACELMLLPWIQHGVECDPSMNVTDKQASSISAMVFLGMLTGAVLSGLISDSIGRRPSLLFSTFLVAVFGLLSAVSTSIVMLDAIRFLVGIGVSGTPAAIALYTEFLPTEFRGQNLVLYLVFFSVGSIFVSLLSWATLPTLGWRFLLFFSAIPALIMLFISIPLLPESPRFLLVKPEQRLLCSWGKRTGGRAALNSLKTVARVNRRALPSKIEIVLDNRPPLGTKHDCINPEGDRAAPKGKLYTLQKSCQRLLTPPLLCPFLLLCLLFFLMAFLYYGLVLLSVSLIAADSQLPLCEGSSTIHQLSNWDYLQVVISNAAEMPGLMFMYLLLDRIGRRYTISVSFLLSGIVVSILIFPRVSGVTQCVILFLSRAFALSFNQSLWVYTTEVFPTAIRTTALGVVTSFARLGGVFAPVFLAHVFQEGSAGHGLVLGSCVAVAFTSCIVALLLPSETGHQGLLDT
ncbi:organic cation/carnitine transporter 7 [Pelomyxa schiedti]|nr:organic cation/carnitine transporter 7 [Pelomyxa schiedti]